MGIIINIESGEIQTNFQNVEQMLDHGFLKDEWLYCSDEYLTGINFDITKRYKVVNNELAEDIEKTNKLKNEALVQELKDLLFQSDYIVIRQMEESTLTPEQFDKVKLQRQGYRNEIASLGG